jgi:hypothetical protein
MVATRVRPCPKLSATQKRVFGLTQAEFEMLWDFSDGCCQICGKPFAPTPQRRCCIDHSHETGQVRGLLCPPCNYALGYRTPQWFRYAAAYLKTPPAYGRTNALHRDWRDA